MTTAFFRASAGACVVDANGSVLALRRRGAPDGAWQMPQGGIESGETPREAVLRELYEEAGLTEADVTVEDELPQWLVYELPVAYRNTKVGWGQAQTWLRLRVHAGAAVRPDGLEFDAFEWLAPAELMQRAVAFRRPVYERVFAELLRAPAGERLAAREPAPAPGSRR